MKQSVFFRSHAVGLPKTLKKLFIILLLVAGGYAIHVFELSYETQLTEFSKRQLVVEGDNALNIGRYADAQKIFEEELKLNPQNLEAVWGLKKATVKATLTGEALTDGINKLYLENATDGHVFLFLGEMYADNHEYGQAQKLFESAIDRNPKLAEAHFDLAMLHEKQGHLNMARVEYLKAIGLTPESRFQNNLATIYFKQQKYEAAISEYGKNLEYPLSILESSKIFWRLGYLSQALSYQTQAIGFLENDSVMNHANNREPWAMEMSPERVIKLTSLEEKKSYGYLCVSATLFLHGNPDAAEQELQKVKNLRLFNQYEINSLVIANLETLLNGNTELSKLVEAFKIRYL